MEKTENNEEQKNFRINIKQSSKGFAYYDVTVRADDEMMLSQRMLTALEIAENTCNKINDGRKVE